MVKTPKLQGYTPILHTKIRPPAPPNGLVVRSRLMRMLDRSLAHGKVTIVCSPAGYGKTTLTSTWIGESRHPVAWLSLEKRDNDMHAFWSYVTAAIDLVCSGIAARLTPLLKNMNPSSYENGLIFLLNECQRHALPIMLVLDDYHLIDSPDIHASVVYFAERLPANLHLVLLTRVELPFKLAKMFAAGQVSELSIADLRFDEEEADDFYRQKLDVHLPSEITKQWTSRTEGWAAGMQLTALLARKSGSEGMQWELSGEDRQIADYLWEEVFARQPEEVQSFLLRTSVLDRFCPPLCDLLTGREDAREMIAWLERNQLFLIPLDLRQGWYRYHHLFSDFLRLQLQRRSRTAFAELHATAASWLTAEGYEEDALEHYLAGNWMNEAALLITRLIPAKIKTEWSLLYRWIEAVPERLLNEQPSLCLTKISLAFLFKDVPEAKRLLQVADALYSQQHGLWKQGDADRFYSDMLALKALLAIEEKDIAATIGYLKEYAERATEESLFVYAHFNAEFVSILRYYPGLEGKLRYAAPSFKQLLELMQYGPPLAASMFAIGYAEVLYEWNRLDEAKAVVEHHLQIGKKLNGQGLIVPLTVQLSRILKAQGDKQSALAALDETLTYPDVADNLFYNHLIHVQKIRLQLDEWDGTVSASERLSALRSVDGLSVHALANWEMYESVVRIEAQIAAGQFDEALSRMNLLWKQAAERDWLTDKVEISLLRSIAWLHKGDTNTAIRHFSEALRLGAPDGYVRVFLDAGKPIVRLMAEYLLLRKNNHIRDAKSVPLAYAKQLAIELRLSVSKGEDPSPHKLVQLTDKEQEVLQLIALGLPNSRIAAELGIGSGTVKTHIHRIYGKLNVNSRVGAIEQCKEWGLSPIET